MERTYDKTPVRIRFLLSLVGRGKVGLGIQS